MIVKEVGESLMPYITACRELEQQQDEAYTIAMKAITSTSKQEMLNAEDFPERGPRKTNQHRDRVREIELCNRLEEEVR